MWKFLVIFGTLYHECPQVTNNADLNLVTKVGIRKSSKKPHAQVTEVMRASNLLYVYARMHQTIHGCRQVSVRVLRTAVREWACCEVETNLILGS